MSREELLNKICMAYEVELKKRMTPDEFSEFSAKVARTLFADELLGMADGEFKDMCLDNFAAITGSPEEFNRLMEDANDSQIFIDDGDLGDEDY